MSMFHSKALATSLATTAIWVAMPSLALADIDFDSYLASYTDPEGDETKPVTSDLCGETYVTCNSDGSVTFTTTNTDGGTTDNSDYQRSEMRMYAAYNDDGNISAGDIQSEMVLDTNDDADDAGGVNAIVQSTLSVDQLPSSPDDPDQDYRYGVIFSQFHGDGAEPMRAYAVSNGDGTFDVMIASDDADNNAQSNIYLGVSISLGEAFDFDASIDGGGLEVTVNGESQSIPMDSDFDDHMLYGKWGAYSSNNEADSGDNSEVTYYEYSIEYPG